MVLLNEGQYSTTDLSKIKEELQCLKKQDPRKLKIFVYKCKSQSEKISLEEKLGQAMSVYKSSNIHIISKLALSPKPAIFCGNNKRVRSKIGEYFETHKELDKFSILVFYSPLTSNKSSRQLITKLRENYKDINFVDISKLHWTERLNTHKIVMAKKVSKYAYVDQSAVNELNQNSEIQEFNYNGSKYQWTSVHMSKDNLDDLMDKFALFNLRKRASTSQQKQIEVKIQINRNNLSNAKFKHYLKSVSEAKSFCLKYLPGIVFSFEKDARLKTEFKISANNFGELNKRAQIFESKKPPSKSQRELLKPVFDNWNKSYEYCLDPTVDALSSKVLIDFVKDVKSGNHEQHYKSETPKKYSIIRRINWKEYDGLTRDLDSGYDSFVFVYSNDCPACMFLKEEVSEMSILNETKPDEEKIQYLKYNSNKNSGFYSTPNFRYVKKGVPRHFAFTNKNITPLTKLKLNRFVDILGKVQILGDRQSVNWEAGSLASQKISNMLSDKALRQVEVSDQVTVTPSIPVQTSVPVQSSVTVQDSITVSVPASIDLK